MKYSNFNKNNMCIINGENFNKNIKIEENCSFIIVTRDEEKLKASYDMITNLTKDKNLKAVNIFVFGTYEQLEKALDVVVKNRLIEEG